MRQIFSSQITTLICDLFITANYYLPSDVEERIVSCVQNEEDARAASVLIALAENARVAREEHIPICQDTGLAFVFLEIGQEVTITGLPLRQAVDEGVRQAYDLGYLRKSAADPITRVNTGDNTPAILYTDIVPGDGFRAKVMPKGFGSENMSRIKMMNPTANEEEIIAFITETVKIAGGNPCPPIIAGIGIGGSFDYAPFLAKKSLLRKIGEYSEIHGELERKILNAINDTDVGPQGFGGKTTALWAAVESYPTHIAALPVAVNISCHATRHAEGVI